MRATAAERERLAADFVRLCEIESPSRDERAVADFVTAELRACGIEVYEDDSAAVVALLSSWACSRLRCCTATA